MTPEVALSLLDQIAQQVSMNRQQHGAAIQAVQVLRNALAPKVGESAEVPAGPALVE